MKKNKYITIKDTIIYIIIITITSILLKVKYNIHHETMIITWIILFIIICILRFIFIKIKDG